MVYLIERVILDQHLRASSWNGIMLWSSLMPHVNVLGRLSKLNTGLLTMYHRYMS
jgi:hypothetical protein